jgi:hypothetical protein
MNDTQDIHLLINEMATLIHESNEPSPQLYALFLQHPELSLKIIELIHAQDEEPDDERPSIYSAGIFALDICVAQLQAGKEAGSKGASRVLEQLMSQLAFLINTHVHSLSFWLPVLNAFYEVSVELNDALKEAYFDLASNESEASSDVNSISHIDAIRSLIQELDDLSVYDIAENFFAQSYAMPPDFFADLIEDLYNIEEGRDIALLALLHPKAEVRDIAVATLDAFIDDMMLSSHSLSRLQSIMHWYPESYKPTFLRWIKNQRKKGVTFAHEAVVTKVSIKATEVDGSGAQGLFIHLGSHKNNRLCGLLLKQGYGIKDTWMTPVIKASEVAEYYHQAFDDNVTLRQVDIPYLKLITEHFLALTLIRKETPSLYLLEIQEALGLQFKPKILDVDELIKDLSVQIVPFTEEVISKSLKRSKSWLNKKEFTESWYIENPVVDKIVNHNCSFVDGVRVCRLEEAIAAVFSAEMEYNRDNWAFHFIWVALWFKACEKKSEKIWQDSFLIAYTIHSGTPLKDIPVMQEICRQTVINSVETMQERRTHLNKE